MAIHATQTKGGHFRLRETRSTVLDFNSSTSDFELGGRIGMQIDEILYEATPVTVSE